MKAISRLLPFLALCGSLALSGCSHPASSSSGGGSSGTGPIPVGGRTSPESESAPESFQDLAEEAQRQLGTMLGAARELISAGARIARLPLGLAQLALRRVMLFKS